MRRLIALILMTTLSTTVFGNVNEEFRATWVITWEFIKANEDAATTKARIRKILDNHQKANMNAVLWQVRQSGTAYYNSSFEPWGYYAGYKNPGFDPIEYAVQEAHKRGIEFHAWFNVFHASSTHSGAPAAEHPEWVCRDGFGNPMPQSRALSPGMKEVRDYTLEVAMEVVKNYDIDGLHLDYIRWNEYDRFDFTENAIQKEKAWNQLDGIFSEEKMASLETTALNDRYLFDIEHPYSEGVPDSLPGVPFTSWESYWRGSTTEFVKTLHDAIQAIKPWVRLSPAAIGKYNWGSWNGFYSVYQNAAYWFNKGYVDQLTPMSYHWLTGNSFYDMLTGGCPQCWGQYIEEGISEGRLFSAGPGSYRLETLPNVWNSRHRDIVRRSRDVYWLDGFQFFSYGSWDDFKYWEQAKSDFFQNITKTRSLNFLYNNPPDSPTISLNNVDSLQYDITVIPANQGNENYWFCVYRSTDDVLNVEENEIILRHFGNTSFEYSDASTGYQDFNGKYTYFATTLNRFWNESEISNSIQSDIIPSFAPVVMQTLPSGGDTIKVNSIMVINFSKKMDTESITNQITITPEIAFGQVKWSGNNSILSLIPENDFDYDTEYTLTLNDSIMDINGKRLDGNNDGGAPEPFILYFRTKKADVDGPVVVYRSQAYNFDTQNVYSFAFDELIDEDTIEDTTAYIMLNDEIISSKSRLYTIDDYSVLGIQPEHPFKPSSQYKIILDTAITDIHGNRLNAIESAELTTDLYSYTDTVLIDNFTEISDANWRDPDYSGSTKGTLASITTFTRDVTHYLPAATRESGQRTAGKLSYAWDPEASEYMIREYLNKTSPEGQVKFDTTFKLQCFVFGDGSYNKFRFSLSEKNGSGYPLEVSYWMTINWMGWKLVERDLSDPYGVGTWLGNEVLDGNAYSFDSFQLSKSTEEGAMTGELYFQHLRAVKKEVRPVYISGNVSKTPASFHLGQNYPNPFNAQTRIDFTIIDTEKTELIIYDMLGRKVTTLINKMMQPGKYSVFFDAATLSTGIYIYELQSGKHRFHKKMMLVK